MAILITGAAGCTASSLIPLLATEPANELVLTDVAVMASPSWQFCDLTDTAAVNSLLESTQPRQIYHLAGSFSNDYETDYKVNVLAAKNLFEGCMKLRLECRILLVGSSAEYGVIDEADNPVTERQLLNPVSIYGVTKAMQTHLMNYYYYVHNLDVVMARTFNLLGRNMSSRLFIGRLYEQIDRFKKGEIGKITLGNLDNRRDYLSVDAAARCYRIIMDHGAVGEIYNVGSGASITIRELLGKILAENGLSESVVDAGGVSSANKLDIKDMYADIGRLLQLAP
jgi:GDP-4-dehydro-6-deoxy-D-mannose reductase